MKYTAAVITISDKGARGERVDTSGPALCALAQENGLEVVYQTIVPDEAEQIKAQLITCADERKIPLILTTGGTGFSPRDITPEATKAVLDREVPGIPEAMRAESMRITPRGCLSRSAAGIRGGSLIINLPGSEKAAKENLLAVMDGILHGLDMLASSGSADCAQPSASVAAEPQKKSAPSMDVWLKEAKSDCSAAQCGMYLFHNGVVREKAKAEARQQTQGLPSVVGMELSYSEDRVSAAIAAAKKLPGIHYVRVWLNEGRLSVGDDIMLVLVGGDIRPHVVDALQTLVGELKSNCVVEKELF